MGIHSSAWAVVLCVVVVVLDAEPVRHPEDQHLAMPRNAVVETDKQGHSVIVVIGGSFQLVDGATYALFMQFRSETSEQQYAMSTTFTRFQYEAADKLTVSMFIVRSTHGCTLLMIKQTPFWP